MMNELRQLAEELTNRRPEWDLAGVLTVLVGLGDRGTVAQLRTAALRTAADQAARTPAAIGFARYWLTAVPAPVPSRRERSLPECANCGQPRRRVHRDGTPARAPARCSTCGMTWAENTDRTETRT